ncbi:MAG: tripartite tricarboxylate transporter substrate binding protein [Rhodoferax sp.]|jgi:tripartite-type tricarboxylate transporter receptor subunit TctC|nr:tripartite tricarboxylate transporter substrate binding protein [Rhodoferax sp.]
MTKRRDFVLGGMATGLSCSTLSVWAQDTQWPEATLKIIVPFAAGNASDLLTRMVGERLQAKFGQPVVVENKVGANGMIGMEAVRTAKADGYSIASATIGTLSINQFLYKKMPHDPETDFAYSTLIWENCNVFMVAASHPAKTLQDLITWSRNQPKGANIGSSAIGSSPYLASVLFKARTGIPATVIPFPSGAQSLMAMMAGDTDFAIDNIASALTLIRSGKVRALAVTANYRWPTLPDVPTTAESGVKDFVLTSWGALVMPKGTPAAIVNKVSAAVQEMASDPLMQQKFMEKGAKLVASTPAQTHAFAASERVKWKEAVQVSGAKID